MTEANRVSTSEAEEKPKRVGFLLEKLDDELFENIVDIYSSTFGGDAKFWSQTANGVVSTFEMLSHSNVAQFRFGSVFSDNSKLEFIQEFSYDPRALGKKVVSIGFYENTSVLPKKQAELGRLKSLFEQSITSLLMEKGLDLLLD